MLLEKSLGKKSGRYMVGYDLSDRDAQISYVNIDYVNSQQPEAETVPAVAGTQQYNIPLALCKQTGTGKWGYGREALQMAADGEGALVENLFSKAMSAEQIVIEEQAYEAKVLLTLFIRKSFGLFAAIAPPDQIEILMFTAKKLSARAVALIGEVVKALHLKNAKVFFQDHVESYYYYLLNQPQEFRLARSVLFDFEDVLSCFNMDWNRRTTPIVSFAEELEFTECTLPVWSQDEAVKKRQMEELDMQVLESVRGLFQNQAVASVFLIGNGFQEDWMDRTLQYLCRGRRVFKGNNLYSKGAAYGAVEKFCSTKAGKEYIFLGKEQLKSNVGLRLLRGGKDAYLALLDAGLGWYDAKCEKELYLESGNSFTVTITPLTNVFPRQAAAGKYPVRYEEIVLEGLPERPKAATRLRISVFMPEAGSVRFRVEDLGLGEIYKSSGLVWERDVVV